MAGPPGVRAVLGLGNPGSGYRRSRHNLGFMVLERLAERHGLRFRGAGAALRLCSWRPGRSVPTVLLAKPTTYMNRSGRGAALLRDDHSIRSTEMLVVLDDIDLPFAKLRVRTRGGPGTHNGMRSVLAAVGDEEVPRLRLGIGPAPPEEDLADLVLADFDPQAQVGLSPFVDEAADCVEEIVRSGVQAAMNRYNPAPPAG